jgi:hypothetical protein
MSASVTLYETGAGKQLLNGVAGAVVSLSGEGVGTMTLHASSGVSVTLSGDAVGKVTLGAVSGAEIGFSESSRGNLGYAAVSSAQLPLLGAAAGQILRNAISSGVSIKFFETGAASLRGVSGGVVAFGESSAGVQSVTSILSSAVIRFGESSNGVVVETTDGVWVINLMTGGHSRYAGDLSGASPVDAFVVTPVSQLGSERAKFVGSAFLNMRATGTVNLSTITDETKTTGPYPTVSDTLSGIHRRRVRLGKGIRGESWQFVIDNNGGSEAAIKSLEVTVVPTKQVVPKFR